jgi:hypothetical protein
MNRFFSRVLLAATAVFGLSALGSAQLWDGEFIDYCNNPPTGEPTDPRSDDYIVYYLENDLFGAALGISGTVSVAAQCQPPNGGSVELRGRIGFSIGPIGSVQDDLLASDGDIPTTVDNGLRLNWGVPTMPGGTWGYAMFQRPDGARTLFGANEMTLAFVGVSDRYYLCRTEVDGALVQLQIDIIGDAARLAWTLQSLDEEPITRGLWFGQWVIGSYPGKRLGAIGNFALLDYVTLPGRRPLQTEERFIRSQMDPTQFPTAANFGTRLNDPLNNNIPTRGYGLQVLNGPNETTTDANGLFSEQATAEEFVVGSAFFLLNGPWGNGATMPDIIFPDTLNDPAYIQKFSQQPVPANTIPFDSIEPQFVCFYRATTGVSNYARPYSVVVDTPRVISVEQDSPGTFFPNPSTIRVYVDNTRGFSRFDREIPMNDVRVTLTLPDGMFVFNAAEPDPLNPTNPQRVISRFINRVDARQIRFVDFQVGTSRNAFGTLPYQVKVEPTPGPTKTLTGSLVVASQPRLLIRGEEGGITGANLVALPWNFQSTNWETILSADQPMRLDQDFRVFTFDPQLQQYILATSPERSKGYWIVSKKELGFTSLGGNPSQPSDTFSQSGTDNIVLKSGWNLIGNPYNYSFPVGQIIGVSGQNNTTSQTFAELVSEGVISGSLAYWDQDTQSYQFTDGAGRMDPNRGYWIFVNTTQDLVLRFPPIFEPFVVLRSAGQWTQNDRQWRLQLAARTSGALDDQNFVGRVTSAADIKRFEAVEPPVAPIDGAVSVAIRETTKGATRSLSSAFSAATGRSEWTVDVFSKKADTVTLTWPNLSTLPRNLRVRLTDMATGTIRDLRRTSGYTFNTEQADTTRSFKLQIEPGTVTRATIGSVVVSRVGRDRNAPVSVNYTLTGPATTSVRILRADGREVFVASRGRSDQAGPNSVTWNLRDSANRAVPPGTYRVEIVAENDSNERSRRIVPVIVTR